MKNFPAFSAPALAMLLALGACAPRSDQSNASVPAAGALESEPAAPAATPTPEAPRETPTPAAAPTKVIGLEGLGDLRIGQPVPKNASWAERGAQTGDACRTVTSPDYPGVYAIVTEGKVQRITVGQRSDVKLVEGVGIGATEQDVRKWFVGFRAEPQKDEHSPTKYLTSPTAASVDPALRFEIGQDGKVKLIHIGTMPVLGYVEGCG
ncbi:hypothetical protein BH11PSE6_BH11PSE6_14840 [soil metagenome]